MMEFLLLPMIHLLFKLLHEEWFCGAFPNQKHVMFPCSYASDVTSGLSDGYEGLSEKSEKTAARRTAGKLFRRRARSRLRITGVR